MNATQSNFVNTGEYNNQFDEFGNLIIIEGSEKYLAVVLTDEVYDNNSVSNVFNVDIEEFKDVTPTSDPKVTALESEKAILQKKVTSLTSQLAKSNPSEKDAIVNANKDIIISLRIKAGEGHIPSDFNTTFPYLPLYSSDAKQSDASGINSSPAQQTSSIPSSSSTTTATTTTTQSSTSSSAESINSNLAVGDACPKQLDIQLVPPTDYKTPGPIPVLPVVISSLAPPPPIVPPSVPIHQVAVQSVVPVVQNVCVEKFYPYGKYAGVWESLGLPTSPLISTYGVYSTKVTESYTTESYDTLQYQVYLPNDGEYTLKFSADNSGYMEIDGTRMIDLSNITSASPYNTQVSAYLDDHSTTKTLSGGWKTLTLFYKNWGGPHSVAATISYQGRLVWTSRMAYNAKDYAECSGKSMSPIIQKQPVELGDGGGCPAVWQLMETKELGIVEARHITVGMHLRDSVLGGWNRVNVAYIDIAPIYRIDIGGQTFDVDHTHKWYVGNNQWVSVTDIKVGDFVENTEGVKIRVNNVYYLRDDQYMHMNVDNERYVMGTNIIGHNAGTFNAKKF